MEHHIDYLFRILVTPKWSILARTINYLDIGDKIIYFSRRPGEIIFSGVNMRPTYLDFEESDIFFI